MRVRIMPVGQPGKVSNLGAVPDRGELMLVKPIGADRVPAILQAGEIVIPKKHVPKVSEMLKDEGIHLPNMETGGKVVLKMKRKRHPVKTTVKRKVARKAVAKPQNINQTVNVVVNKPAARRRLAKTGSSKATPVAFWSSVLAANHPSTQSMIDDAPFRSRLVKPDEKTLEDKVGPQPMTKAMDETPAKQRLKDKEEDVPSPAKPRGTPKRGPERAEPDVEEDVKRYEKAVKKAGADAFYPYPVGPNLYTQRITYFVQHKDHFGLGDQSNRTIRTNLASTDSKRNALLKKFHFPRMEESKSGGEE